MVILTLLVKASRSAQIKQIDDMLKAEFENLDLDVNVLGNSVRKWVQVSLSGEDEVIATSYINKKIGTCPTNLKNVSKFSVLKGYISNVDSTKEDLKVDVGVFEPKIIQASIPLTYLRAQLADGREVDLKNLSEVYGLKENLPVGIKITVLKGGEEGAFQAEFSTEQIEKIRLWQQSLLDRLIILGSSTKEIETVLEGIRLNRDVIGTEALGFFEYALTCKLGTDATGLIPKIGKYMRNAEFIIFNPKKIAGLMA